MSIDPSDLARPSLDSILEALRAQATERTRATYLRHGIPEPVLGVLVGELEKLRKRLRTRHALARELWATGIYEARYLATLIMEVSATSEAELSAWADSAKDASTAEALAAFAVRTPFRERLTETWTGSPREALQRAGWSLLARCWMQDPDLPEGQGRDWIGRIEGVIHSAPNWVRRTMMYALLSIGGASPALRREAEAAIRRIGPVAFDPGKTACRFPDALPYLDTMWKRKAASSRARGRR